MHTVKEYAFYKGDKLLGLGTIAEISKQVGISESSIRFYGTNTYRKRRKGPNGRYLILIEEDE